MATVALLGVALLAIATPSECARAFFVFGDSLVDNGNNNFLNDSGSAVRADYLPYGVETSRSGPPAASPTAATPSTR